MKRILIGMAAALAVLSPLVGATAATETVIHRFVGQDYRFDGDGPHDRLIMDATGALYGTTANGGAWYGGTVFRLTPPAAGQTTWVRTILHSFKGAPDGAVPYAGLIMDVKGALYGTTTEGGGGTYNGTVFRLTPPAAGQTAWTETVLHRFKGKPDGLVPNAGLIMDGTGALYGRTGYGGSQNRGTVFRLTPPAAGQTIWSETVLYDFGASTDTEFHDHGLIMDGNGVLYGTTYYGGNVTACDLGCGTVFKLTPPAAGQTTWIETDLHNFEGPNGSGPIGGLIMDTSGALYGTTSAGGNTTACIQGCGVVFRLAPPAAGQTRWTETVLHKFRSSPDGVAPYAGLTMDVRGTLYGTTCCGGLENGSTPFGGTVFMLAPPAAGQTVWTETVLHRFKGKFDGIYPLAGLIMDTHGTLFGTTELGGSSKEGGTVFQLIP